jgi:cholesterol oxidase
MNANPETIRVDARANVTVAGSDSRHYDAVVIGSGFGGAVAAYHLVAGTGLKVLLLERGMPYPPGSFARTPRQMRRAFWDPDRGVHGLLEMWSFSKVRALVASGLGGGSLIYANVLLRKPGDTFAAGAPDDFTPWPVQRADLEAEYDDVARRLRPNPLPDDYFTPPPEQGGVAKTQAFFAAARAAGLTPERAPLAITFRDRDDAPAQPGVPFGADNLHARTRHTCTLVGECDLGCNEGAKNSLDYTYLTDFVKLRPTTSNRRRGATASATSSTPKRARPCCGAGAPPRQPRSYSTTTPGTRPIRPVR